MINFELNNNLNDFDKKKYENSIDELDNLSDKNVFLLKDAMTKFSHYKNSSYKDIKSVWIIILNDDFKIKIKGNLSFSENRQMINFYPIFIDKFKKFNENEKYFYNIDTSISKITNRIEKGRMVEKLYSKIINEFKSPKYTPPAASTEWKDFIEPYEYYVDLKFELLKQDFIMLEGFEQKPKKVIYLSRENDQFKNYLTNKTYDYEYEDNKNRGLILNYDKYKSNFNNKFLKRNTYLLARKVKQFDKDNYEKALKEGEKLNYKFKINASKSTFFTTKNTYTSKDLKNGRSISREDSQIETHLAFVREIEESHSNIDLNIMNISSVFNSLKEFDIIKFKKESEINEITRKLLKLKELPNKIENEFKKVKRNITMNFNNISEEDVDFANNILNKLDSIEETSDYSEAYLSVKDFVYNFESEVNEIKVDRDYQLDKIKSKKGFSEKILLSVQEEFKQSLSKCVETNGKELNGLILEFNKLISNDYEIIKNILNYMKKGIVRVVKYEQEINLLFNFDKDCKDKTPKVNYYMLNTGDMVLVDTIKRINTKIKRGEEMNDKILNKIIQKEKLSNYIDVRVKDEFFPGSYDDLNKSQQKAFRLAIDTEDPISIIQGPPGTGKTEVITNIVKYFHKKGMRTIISSQTNVAIKNVIDKLCSNSRNENSILIPWLTTMKSEIYSLSNIDDTWSDKVRENILSSGHSLTEKWDLKRRELIREEDILKDLVLSKDVKAIAATTTTSTTLPNRGYDGYLKDVKVLIIDEVSKSILPEILRYALDVEKVILVGDYKQLNPIFDIDPKNIESDIDQEKFRDLKNKIESGIFYNLSIEAEKVDRIATLDVNYRSVPGVLDAYNVFYSGKNGKGLEGYRNFKEYSKEYIFENSNFFDSKHSLYMINVKGAKEDKRGTSRYNKGEISALLKGLHDLARTLVNAEEKEIAIIFPYSAQINLFNVELSKPKNAILKDAFKKIQYDTVDSFQGSEADIVFLSTVITDSNNRNFLSDFRRINVSMSRAKDMLVIFGNLPVLKKLEISGDGITSGKYFTEILDEKKNKYLKVIDITEKGGKHD